MSNRKISKSRYLRGLQCPKLLWLSVNEPEAEELKPDLLAQHRFATGHKVGKLAQEHFPGGVSVEDTKDFQSWINETKNAISSTAPAIFEAAFSNDFGFVAVDVLERNGPRWNIIEVKSALDVKDTYIDDLAIQYWLLREQGLEIGKTEVMLINRGCTFPDLENLFVRHDVTERVLEAVQTVEGKVKDLCTMLSRDIPNVEVGSHCASPYPCPFKIRCWPQLPEHHVSTLYRITPDKVAEYQESGVGTVYHFLDDVNLTQIQARQVTAVKSGEIVVNDELKSELDKIQFPAAFLDFETIAPAIPLWEGCRPYQPVAVQMSCHLVDEGGHASHHEWIIENTNDPRESIANAIIESCSEAKTIVAYNAPFEKRCIKDIASYLETERAKTLLSINERFVDLLPIVRNNIYHPEFLGSFSIKSVLPALIPELSYSNLEVGDGMTASIKLESFASGEPEDWESTKPGLLEYCALDTLAMYKLYQELKKLTQH